MNSKLVFIVPLFYTQLVFIHLHICKCINTNFLVLNFYNSLIIITIVIIKRRLQHSAIAFFLGRVTHSFNNGLAKLKKE